jgi:hypothetical protein
MFRKFTQDLIKKTFSTKIQQVQVNKSINFFNHAHTIDEKTLLELQAAREVQAALPDKFTNKMSDKEWNEFFEQSEAIRKNSSVY